MTCESWDGEALLPRRRKSRGLLAYLALARGRPVARSRIAGLLWDTNTEDQARGSLRQALVDVTASLLPAGFAAIEARRDDLVLRSDAYILDLSVFDEKPSLEPGARLPTAPLLEDLDGLSESFDHFLAEERVRADHLRLRWHEARLKSLDSQSEPEARLHVARALLAVDLAHEQAWRVVIRAQADLGDVGQALQQFRECEAALARLLDARPSAETTALIAEIHKRGRSSATPAVVSAPSEARLAAASSPYSELKAFDAPSVAVLPFRWLGPENEEAWLSEGVTEDIVCVLTGIREPVVISSNSSRQFKDDAQPRGAIADRLGADYLVTGSIRMAGDRVRISVSLEEGRSGATLWAETYPADRANLFDTQTEIAARIAHALSPRVQAEELRQSLRNPPDNLSAYHLMLRARERMFQLNRTSFEEAGALLRQALELDQGNASLFSTLADWYSLRIFQGWSDDWDRDKERLEQAAGTALRLHPDHPRTLALLGHNVTIADRNYEEGRSMLDRSVQIAPNDPEVMCWSVPNLAYTGEAQEAIARAKKVIALSPQDPLRFRHEHFLSVAYYAADDYEEATRWGLSALEKNSNYTACLRVTIASLVAMDRIGESRRLVDQLRDLKSRMRRSPTWNGLPFSDDRKRVKCLERLATAGLEAREL